MTRRKKTSVRKNLHQIEIANQKQAAAEKQAERVKLKEKWARSKEAAALREVEGIEMTETKSTKKTSILSVPQPIPPKAAPIPLDVAITQIKKKVEAQKSVSLTYNTPKKITRGIQKRSRAKKNQKTVKIDVSKVVAMELA